MKTIDSQSTITNSRISLRTKIMNAVCWFYEHTLDYPIVEDKPKNISGLRRQVEENKKNYRIFSHYN